MADDFMQLLKDRLVGDPQDPDVKAREAERLRKDMGIEPSDRVGPISPVSAKDAEMSRFNRLKQAVQEKQLNNEQQEAPALPVVKIASEVPKAPLRMPASESPVDYEAQAIAVGINPETLMKYPPEQRDYILKRVREGALSRVRNMAGDAKGEE